MKKAFIIFVLIIIVVAMYVLMMEQQETIQKMASREASGQISRNQKKPLFAYKSIEATKIDLSNIHYN